MRLRWGGAGCGGEGEQTLADSIRLDAICGRLEVILNASFLVRGNRPNGTRYVAFVTVGCILCVGQRLYRLYGEKTEYCVDYTLYTLCWIHGVWTVGDTHFTNCVGYTLYILCGVHTVHTV